ncbi:hypothetical protein PENTCL1PPCAC_12734, partial [Pristionchus entomophagus]
MQHMNLHGKESDSSRMLFVCNICGKTYAQKGHPNVHNKMHSAESDPSKGHECDICGKECTFKTFLILVDDDPRKGNTQCDICGKKLSSYTDLNGHIQNENDPQRAKIRRPHKCEECGRCFPKAVGLRNHMFLHTG